MTIYEAILITADGRRTSVTTEADNRADAKYAFAHSLYMDETGMTISGRIDYRSVKRVIEPEAPIDE